MGCWPCKKALIRFDIVRTHAHACRYKRGLRPQKQSKTKRRRKESITFTSNAGFGQECHRGPFSQAQDGFWRQGVIGAFGESSTGLLKLVKTWAWHAALGDLGAAVLLATGQHGQKGGSIPMHQQFLRAIGVMTATGIAALKLNRIHYL